MSSIENPFKFDGIMNAEKGMLDFLYEIPFGNFLIVSGFIFSINKSTLLVQ